MKSFKNKVLENLFSTVKNRSEFARKWKVPGGASMIYQHVNGIKPISLETGLIYSKAFNVPLHAISPELGEVLKSIERIIAFDRMRVAEQFVEESILWMGDLARQVALLTPNHQLAVKTTMRTLVESLG